MIKAGTSSEVTLEVPLSAFETVGNDGERAVRGSTADLFVGFGQPDGRTAELYGSKSVEIKGIPVKG